jgi:hypothetical protein
MIGPHPLNARQCAINGIEYLGSAIAIRQARATYQYHHQQTQGIDQGMPFAPLICLPASNPRSPASSVIFTL